MIELISGLQVVTSRPCKIEQLGLETIRFVLFSLVTLTSIEVIVYNQQLFVYTYELIYVFRLKN